MAIIETPHVRLLMDGSALNVARSPRLDEVETLFQRWDAKGLLACARYCPEPVPDTRDVPPEEAVQAIERVAVPIQLGARAYLRLLSVHGLFEIKRFCASAA